MTVWIPLEVRLRLRDAFEVQQRARVYLGAGGPREITARELRTIIEHSPPGLQRQGVMPRILFFNLRDWPGEVALMATLARALMLRGAHCTFLTCGGGLPACDAVSIQAPVLPPCHSCSYNGVRWLEALRLPHHPRREFVKDAAVRQAQRRCATLSGVECEAFTYHGVPLGRLIDVSVAWILRRETSTALAADEALSLYRNLLASGIVAVQWLEEALHRLQPDILFMPSGLFFAEAIAAHLAEREGIPYTTFEGGLRGGTWAFAHDAPAGHWDHITDVWPAVALQPLSRDDEERLDSHLLDRQQGGADGSYLSQKRGSEPDNIILSLGLRQDLPTVVAFPNITWDSAGQKRDVAFSGMIDWLFSTVEVFLRRPDWQLIIRAHPAEASYHRSRTNEPVLDRLRARFPVLPDNIRLIAPEQPLNSYTIMRQVTAGIVNTSTTGLEMALMGKPVCVAGQVHYRGRGFTIDVLQREELTAALELALAKRALTSAECDLARRYAFHIAFRLSVPTPWLSWHGDGAYTRLAVQSLSDLQPGVLPELDFICERLLSRQPIILPGDL